MSTRPQVFRLIPYVLMGWVMVMMAAVDMGFAQDGGGGCEAAPSASPAAPDASAAIHKDSGLPLWPSSPVSPTKEVLPMSDPIVVMYSKDHCPYCVRAQQFFKQKGIPFTVMDVEDNEALRAEMIQKANGRTSVPQIFIHGRHVGGFDDLITLASEGKLDVWLAGTSEA